MKKMLHKETISISMWQILQVLNQNICLPYHFKLGGGTALALQLGHRQSIDLDFFTNKDFNAIELLKLISNLNYNVSEIYETKNQLRFIVNGIKVDFVYLNIPFVFQSISIENILLLSIEEIAAMKLYAILHRGEKKDYWDIGELLNSYSLQELLKFFEQKYLDYSTSLVVKYLNSFSDIEYLPNPISTNNIQWTDIKKRILIATENYIKG